MKVCVHLFFPSLFGRGARGEGAKRIPLKLLPHPTLSQRERVKPNKKAATRAALCCSFCCWSLNDYHALVFIKISEHHFYDLALLRRHVLADVVSLNR